MEASSSLMVEDEDDVLAEAAKLANAHARATNDEHLERVLLRSKRAGQHMSASARGRAVELVIESASKKSKCR